MKEDNKDRNRALTYLTPEKPVSGKNRLLDKSAEKGRAPRSGGKEAENNTTRRRKEEEQKKGPKRARGEDDTGAADELSRHSAGKKGSHSAIRGRANIWKPRPASEGDDKKAKLTVHTTELRELLRRSSRRKKRQKTRKAKRRKTATSRPSKDKRRSRRCGKGGAARSRTCETGPD